MSGVTRRQLVLGAGGAAALPALGAIRPAFAATAPSWTTHDAAVAKYTGQVPTYWGMYGPGVRTRFSTATAMGANAIALTFDACGGSATRYDSGLIAVLRKYRVPATLFINRHWAENNRTIFASLLADPLFEIENHGVAHVPLSVNGRSAWGIKGTTSVSGAWFEIAGCDWWMHHYYNHTPRFMRPGTAYTDDVTARMATFMGQTLVGFAINGDGGATYPAATVYSETIKARPGNIVIAHMNHPGGGTAPGFDRAIPTLLSRGIKFRRLREVL